MFNSFIGLLGYLLLEVGAGFEVWNIVFRDNDGFLRGDILTALLLAEFGGECSETTEVNGILLGDCLSDFAHSVVKDRFDNNAVEAEVGCHGLY